jgi:hypothetical protein
LSAIAFNSIERNNAVAAEHTGRHMRAYETSATVGEQGKVQLTGLPFAPGTQVDVIVSPAANGEVASAQEVERRAAALFAAMDKARNISSVAPFRRDELYDRNVLR